jgi:hypothetical protein
VQVQSLNDAVLDGSARLVLIPFRGRRNVVDEASIPVTEVRIAVEVNLNEMNALDGFYPL